MEFSEFAGVRQVDPDDTFRFRCSRCGECCHNVKEAIMLSSFDLFQLAKHIGRPIEEVIEEYTVPVPLTESNFPVLMLKTKQYGDVCVFYKKGICAVQAAKPLVCRLYLLNIGPDNRDVLGYFIVSKKPHHYTGITHRVGDWMDENLTTDDRKFMLEWYEQAGEQGKLMRSIEKTAAGKETL